MDGQHRRVQDTNDTVRERQRAHRVQVIAEQILDEGLDMRGSLRLAPPSHGYTDVECSPRSAYCDRADDSHRYVDWNGYRLLPFADPDQVYVEKTR